MTERAGEHVSSRATPAGAVLRPATTSDLPGIERLLTAAQLPTEGVADALASFIVAESDSELVGVVGLEIHEEGALLRSTAVEPAWRGRGLGRALVERIIHEAEAGGIRALYLLTTTAEHYFPSFGFTRTTREAVPRDVRDSPEFQGACPASAVVMAKQLRTSVHPAPDAASGTLEDTGEPSKAEGRAEDARRPPPKGPHTTSG
jgi:amino-acid N-acetyltransferase